MRKISLILSLLFLFVPVLFSEDVKVPFDGGCAYIPQVDGKDDLNSVRIEYDNGDVFFGKGTADGFPIEGILSNEKTQIFYEGSFDDDEKYTGEGTLDTPKFNYRGSFKNGKRNGYGSCFDKKTNKIYEGNFVDDKKQGKGKEYESDSNYYYEGSWLNDKYHGQGLLISESGTKFEGCFENGKIKGYGNKTNSTGEVLKGNWKNADLLNGENCSYISNGKAKYSGSFVDGKFDGLGTYTDDEGTTYEGTFSENQRTGIGQQVYSDGSVYTGYYFGNQRNGQGSFEFSNGMQYEGGFLNGTFYGTGYLSAEENDEITIIASDEWNGIEIPENSDSDSTTSADGLLAAVALPKTGKILFSNGDMWEGYMQNGLPVAGLGIWTTQEERLAKMNSQDSHVVLASYQLNNKNYDLSSVYSDYEVAEIISSDAYLVGFNDFYKKHKATIDKVVGGLQAVAAVLTIIPSPIQPIAAAVDIGLSVAQISLKTISTSIDIYDACMAGNKNLVPELLKDYGKDIAWDAINIIFATPGSGQAIAKVGSKVSEGMGKAGKAISQTVGKAVAKNQTLAHAAMHLGQLGKVGKGAGRAFVEAAGKSEFFQFVARNGGKITKTVKNGWIKLAYPKVFAQYGDDATRLLFKYGNDISAQMAKNGDVIVKAVKENGDDVARIFLKNGDEIAKVARASEYPEAVIRYIKNSSNAEDAIRLAKNNPALGRIVKNYGDEAITFIEKYGDDAIKILEKDGSQFTNALKKLPREKHDIVFSFFKNSENAGNLYAKYSDSIIELYEKVGVTRREALIKTINRDGDKAVGLLKNTPNSQLRKTIDVLETAPNPEIENAFKYVQKTKNCKVVGEGQQDFVYRVIRADENPKIGLYAKNPNRNMTIDGHVRTGSRNNGSQFISTTTDYDIAKKWAEMDGCQIVKIELNKIPNNVNIYDLSIKEGQELYLKGLTQNFAKGSKEVLLEGAIPPSAITLIN